MRLQWGKHIPKQTGCPNFTVTVRTFCVFTFISFYCDYYWSLRWDRRDGPPAAWPLTSALSAAAPCSLSQWRCRAPEPAQLLPLWCKAGAMCGGGGPREPWIYPATAGGAPGADGWGAPPCYCTAESRCLTMQVPRCYVGTDGYERAARGECERYKLHLKARLFNLRRSLSAASALVCVVVTCRLSVVTTPLGMIRHDFVKDCVICLIKGKQHRPRWIDR